MPLVLVGGLEHGAERVIALGHPDGLPAPADYPPGAKIYGMIRIKGVDKQPDEVRLPVPVKRG